jgi:hypothetical protein
MTLDEAKRVFKAWQEYIEIAEKLRQLFNVVPESFLPYPVDTLEEALNIIAKDYFDAGDKRTANDIQRLMTLHLVPYCLTPSNGNKLTDDEALERMKLSLDLTLKHPELKMGAIQRLKAIQDSWIKLRGRAHERGEPK